MGDFKSHGVAVCTPRQQQQLQDELQQKVEEKADVDVIGNEGNMSAYFAIRHAAANRVHPTGTAVWWGKATRNDSRVHSAVGKLAVAENGRGVLVGCLQQYRKRWGFVRMTSRT